MGRVLVAAALAAVVGCGREEEAPPATGAGASTHVLDSAARARDSSRSPATFAVQVGSFSDSARAGAFRDSLARSGWRPEVARAVVNGTPHWRVLLAPTRDSALARLFVVALAARGTRAVLIGDGLAEVRDNGVRVTQVNYGTHGMAARVRWVVSSDGRHLLVTEDPTAVEAEPVPNGFVYANEHSGAWLQMDDVWEVTPSPDWRALAYGKAYRINSGEAEPTAAQWATRAREISVHVPRQVLPAASDAWAARFTRALREHSFPSSGMAIAYAVGVAFTVRVDTMTPLADDAPRRVTGPATLGTPVLLEGWRTRWTRTGDTLAVGTGPKGSQDYSPPEAWILVRPAPAGGGDSLGIATDSTRFAPVSWVEGPTMDISLPIDLTASSQIRPGRARVVAQGGWIHVQRPGERTARIVGPGKPLVATRDGRFIVAIAPRIPAREYENPTVLVVYQVN